MPNLPNSIVGALVALLGLSAAVTGAQAAPNRDLPLESAMEVRKLEDIRKMADHTARQQMQVFEQALAELNDFFAVMRDIGATVSEAVNTWALDPSPQNEARVTVALTTGAARGREAAATVADTQAKVRRVTAVIQDTLEGEIAAAQTAINNAQRRADRYAAQRAKVRDAIREAKYLLETRGYLASVDIPPELEDKLAELIAQYEELEVTAHIWRDAMPVLDNARTELERTRREYTEINRFVGIVANQAASAERIFAHIGAAESEKIRLPLIADAFAQSSAFRAQLGTALGRMRELRANFHKSLRALRRLPDAEQSPRADSPRRAPSTGVLEWFREWEPEEEESRSQKPDAGSVFATER